MKTCTKCKIEKEDWKFSADNSKSDGLANWCCKCWKLYRSKIGDYHRSKNLQERYGINTAQYELMLKSQNGVCAICGRPETRKRNNKILPLSVDHCHTSLKIRGLLCGKCNDYLKVIEDLDWLPKAQAYLEKYK